MRPCLVVAYAAWPLKPLTPAPDEVLTIAPPPCSTMSSSSCFMLRKAPRRLTATRRSHSSSVISAAGLIGCSMPALLMAMSRRPNLSAPGCRAALTSSPRATSQDTASDRAPACSIMRAVSRLPSAGNRSRCSSLADVRSAAGGDDRVHAIASVTIDRVGGENLPPPRDVRDARFDRVRAVSIVRELVSIGIADRGVRSSND
jgi:hypothetical protein